MLSSRGSTLPLLICSARVDELLDEVLQLRRRRRADRIGPALLQLRHRQIEHRGGLHVGGLAEHLHQFRHIDEAGEASVQTIAAPSGLKLHRRHGLAERGRPRIEVMQAVFRRSVLSCR